MGILWRQCGSEAFTTVQLPSRKSPSVHPTPFLNQKLESVSNFLTCNILRLSYGGIVLNNKQVQQPQLSPKNFHPKFFSDSNWIQGMCCKSIFSFSKNFSSKNFLIQIFFQIWELNTRHVLKEHIFFLQKFLIQNFFRFQNWIQGMCCKSIFWWILIKFLFRLRGDRGCNYSPHESVSRNCEYKRRTFSSPN